MVIGILTNEDLPEYREAAFQNGANYFFVKGSSAIKEIMALAHTILSGCGSNLEG